MAYPPLKKGLGLNYIQAYPKSARQILFVLLLFPVCVFSRIIDNTYTRSFIQKMKRYESYSQRAISCVDNVRFLAFTNSSVLSIKPVNHDDQIDDYVLCVDIPFDILHGAMLYSFTFKCGIKYDEVNYDFTNPENNFISGSDPIIQECREEYTQQANYFEKNLQALYHNYDNKLIYVEECFTGGQFVGIVIGFTTLALFVVYCFPCQFMCHSFSYTRSGKLMYTSCCSECPCFTKNAKLCNDSSVICCADNRKFSEEHQQLTTLRDKCMIPVLMTIFICYPIGILLGVCCKYVRCCAYRNKKVNVQSDANKINSKINENVCFCCVIEN